MSGDLFRYTPSHMMAFSFQFDYIYTISVLLLSIICFLSYMNSYHDFLCLITTTFGF
jgi:hypothetical protein